MTTGDEHRRLRELLGAYALGGLPDDLVPGLRAHLDGCASCRGELADIAPLRDRLRGVDVDALSDTPVPPPDLGERIRARVAQESVLVARRARPGPTSRRLLAAAAAVAVLTGAVGVGAAVGRGTPPTAPVALPTPTAPLPVEEVALQAGRGVTARTATVVAHSWGVGARFAGRLRRRADLPRRVPRRRRPPAAGRRPGHGRP